MLKVGKLFYYQIFFSLDTLGTKILLEILLGQVKELSADKKSAINREENLLRSPERQFFQGNLTSLQMVVDRF